MKTLTVEEAKAYFKEHPKGELRVKFDGRIRRIFANGAIDPTSRRNGYGLGIRLEDAEAIYPGIGTLREQMTSLVNKFKKNASKASFMNPFIRKCIEADPEKSLRQNGITRNNWLCVRNLGEVVTLDAIRKNSPETADAIRDAIANKSGLDRSGFTVRGLEAKVMLRNEETGFDGTLFLVVPFSVDDGTLVYRLINDKEFILVDEEFESRHKHQNRI